MKKLITLTCLLSAFALSAKAEIKTVFVSGENKEASIEIGEGEVGECLFVTFFKQRSDSSDTLSLITEIYIQKDGITNSAIVSPPSSFHRNGLGPEFVYPVVAGPAKITLVLRDLGRTGFMTFKVRSNSDSGEGNNVTVLPKETENMELILESSDDMVKWEKDVIGDKPKANRKKFYRLRAVKK